MKRNIVETVLGGIVILWALIFLIYSYNKGDTASPAGYEITADFSSVGGLKSGDEVQIGGVRVGTVKSVELVTNNYLARVHMSVSKKIKLPSDTTALISSQSLLGGRYLQLEPGAEEEIIPPGGRIQYTQAPQNLEQLLGRFIFSAKDAKDAHTAAAPQTSNIPIPPAPSGAAGNTENPTSSASPQPFISGQPASSPHP